MFIDCGVNIGMHSLFMAVNGVRIFGVDPLEENLLHVSCALYVKKGSALHVGNFKYIYYVTY